MHLHRVLTSWHGVGLCSIGCQLSSGILHPRAEAALEGDRCLDVELPTVDSLQQWGLQMQPPPGGAGTVGSLLLFFVSAVIQLALGSLLAALLTIPTSCFFKLLTTTDP